MSQKENLKTKKLYFELFKISQYKTGNYIKISCPKRKFETKKTIFSSYLKLHNIKQETILKFLTQKENLKTKKTIFRVI